MNERIEGKGLLRSIRPPIVEFDVVYQFDIVTAVVRRPGFPPVAGHSHSKGTVRAVNGQFIPEGIHQLEAEDGETLRVTNVGLGEWCILSSQR